MKNEKSGRGGGTMRSSLRPLTEAERNVASENYWIVERFLRAKKLPEDEWFDVIIFRYLLTVERWFRQPRLYRYEFSTLAWRSMDSAVWAERSKQSRRIKTVSLSNPVPGTEDLTWEDMVTTENLIYIPYLTEERE